MYPNIDASPCCSAYEQADAGEEDNPYAQSSPSQHADQTYDQANRCEFFIGIDVSAAVRSAGQLDLSRAASSFIDILRVYEPMA